MNDNNNIIGADISDEQNRKSGWSIASFILSAFPIAILLMGFLFCLIASGMGLGAIWWLFIALIWIMVPVTIIANIVSVILGVKGLKIKKTIFAWAGIIVVLIEIIAVILIYGIVTLVNMPEENARKQEILQLQKEISNYETYTDLTSFGLGLYKLKNEGDEYLWDITKPEDTVINYEGVEMVYKGYNNRKDHEGFDNAWGNSNEGKDVEYDVYFYDNTYIIVTPLWDKPGTLYYWGYIYLCKDINKNVDLFDVGILDPKVVEKLHELPGEKYSRKKLTEKLGKTF